MGNEWDINMQTVIIVETELIVRNLPQHYGDERIKWFAHSRVGSPRILNQLGVFVDIKTRIGCPRPPLRTPQSRPVTGCVHPIKGQGWRLWTNNSLPSCSSSPHPWPQLWWQVASKGRVSGARHIFGHVTPVSSTQAQFFFHQTSGIYVSHLIGITLLHVWVNKKSLFYTEVGLMMDK